MKDHETMYAIAEDVVHQFLFAHVETAIARGKRVHIGSFDTPEGKYEVFLETQRVGTQ